MILAALPLSKDIIVTHELLVQRGERSFYYNILAAEEEERVA